MTLLPLIMAIAPALFIAYYYYRQDKKKPEPKKLIIKIFILGIVSIFPVVIIEVLVSRLLGNYFNAHPLSMAFFRAFIVAGVCEEFIKMRIVLWFAYNRPAFDEIMDGIVYTIIASMGFACLENIMYVKGDISIAIVRAITAVPLHAVASGIMGYYIGRARFSRGTERPLLIKGLSAAVLIHGTYDFILFSQEYISGIIQNNISWLLIFPLLLASFFVLKNRIAHSLKLDEEAGRV